MNHVHRVLLCSTVLVHLACAAEDSEAATATEGSEASETMQNESNGATEGAQSETEGHRDRG